MFECPGDKIKAVAKILFVSGCILFLILGIVILSSNEDLWIISILLWVFGALFSYISGLLVYGFGELITNSEIAPRDTGIAVGKAIAAENAKTKASAPTVIPAASHKPVSAPVASEKKTAQEEKKEAVIRPEQTAELQMHLGYALQYQTEEGMIRYLNSVREKLSQEEQQALFSILAAPKGKLRMTINSYLNSK